MGRAQGGRKGLGTCWGSVWSLLMLTGHLFRVGSWAVWAQERDKKVEEDWAQEGEALCGPWEGWPTFGVGASERQHLPSGRSGLLPRPWCTSGGSRQRSWRS